MSKYSWLLCASLLSSCGTSSKVVQPKPDSRQQKDVKDCYGNLVEDKSLKPGYRLVDGNRLYLLNDDSKRVSFCDAAKGSKVLILQLAGVTCLSCQYESEFIVKDVVSSEISHAVVFTDYREDYPTSDFKRFMKSHAPESRHYFDDRANLWKIFSLDPAQPTRPTVIVFGKDGVSFVYNESGESIEDIGAVAAKLGDLSPPEPKPEPEPEPKPGDLKVNLKLKGLDGKSVGLGEVFKKEFALIDFSQTNCIYCKTSARAYNNDAHFQKTVSSGRCDFLTLVPSRDNPSWGALFSGTFVGNHSFSAEELTSAEVAKAFAYTLRATPSYILVDREGKLLDSRTGALPRRFFETCSK